MGADLDISVVEQSLDVTLATLSVEVGASGPDPILDISILETAVNVDVAEMSLAIEMQEAVLEVSTQEAVIEVEAAGPRGAAGEPGTGAAIEVPFSYGDATPEFLMTVPDAELVQKVGILITTPFNGVGAALKIGSSLAPASLMAQGENNPAEAGTYETHPNVSYGAATGIYLTTTPGAGASQGAGVVTLIAGESAAGQPAPIGSDGVIITRIAAQALGGHRLVYASSATGCNYADNTVYAQRFAILGLTIGAAAIGAEVSILSFGMITELSWVWTPGPLYLGIDGLITQTPPVAPAAFLLVVGAAVDATHVLIDLHEPIVIQ